MRSAAPNASRPLGQHCHNPRLPCAPVRTAPRGACVWGGGGGAWESSEPSVGHGTQPTSASPPAMDGGSRLKPCLWQGTLTRTVTQT